MRNARSILLDTVPDEPRWLGFRAPLLADWTTIHSVGSDAWWIEDPGLAFACGIGSLDRSAFESVPRAVSTVLIQSEDLAAWKASLPGWRVLDATCHVHPEARAWAATAHEGARVFSLGEPFDTTSLPESLGREIDLVIARGRPLATYDRNGEPVAFCYAGLMTESLWDVSVHALESARRQGAGRRVFETLASAELERGHRAVWGCLDSNAASMAMARRLGFEVEAKLYILVEDR